MGLEKSHLFYTAFYCNLWPVWLYYIFVPDLINDMIKKNNYIISRNSEIFLILRIIQSYTNTNLHRSVCKVAVSLVRF
jgi:hypothetical protein